MAKLLVRLVLTLVAIGCVALMFTGTLDELSRVQTEKSLKRALITYGVARGLNGVISVAQGTEVAVEPAGIGVTFAPGQILDPINDLIERFSWILLASSTSLGIQRVMINVTAWIWFSALAGLALTLAITVWWRAGAATTAKWRGPLIKTALVFLIIRFTVPVIAIGSETFYQVFLEPQYLEAKGKLEETSARIETISETNPPLTESSDTSLLGSAKRAYRSARGAIDLEARMAALKEAVADISEYTLNLIVVFVVETILFPLLFLWLSLQLIKRTLSARF